MNRVRIVLADDHALMRAGLRMLIEGQPDLELIEEASSGLVALAAITRHRPDIAILDVSLPGMNGILLARRCTEVSPDTGIIILTQHDDRRYLRQALDAGARGYVLKQSTTERLIAAIRGVRVGGLYVDPALAGELPDSHRPKAARSAGATALTEREEQVLRWVAKGLTTKEIALRLDLGAKSVETYKARGSAKIEARTRAEIVRYAAAQGWLADV